MWTKLCAATILLAVLAGCTAAPAPSKPGYSSLPEHGNVQRGERLFTTNVNGVPSCATCHRTDAVNLVGPGMVGFAARAATRVQGVSAREYAYQSIVTPAKYVVSGFTNVMYDKYAETLSPQDFADVIDYLLQVGSK